MVYAKYKNEAYEPRVHDFGDAYHLPDDCIDDNDSVLSKVKMIRKRYTDWFRYQDAIELYDRYMKNLFQKYGGKKQFKLAVLLGQMRDYIPNYPELRKTKRNKYFIENRVRANYVLGEPEFEAGDTESLPPAIVEVTIGKESKSLDGICNSIMKRNRVKEDQIVEELDIMDSYWRKQHEKEMNSLKKKDKKKYKKLLRRKISFQSIHYRSLMDKVNLYDKRKRDKFMGIEEGEQERFVYKDAVFTRRQSEDMAVIERLKELGVRPPKLTKAQTRVIRASKKEQKKREKLLKKNREDERHFMSDFTNDQFDDFMSFEQSMLDLTGTRRFE